LLEITPRSTALSVSINDTSSVSGSATAPEPGNVCDNFNIIIQHFFSGVVLHGTDPSALLKLLDMNKLQAQIKQFARTI
jgi:hypothetical protein